MLIPVEVQAAAWTSTTAHPYGFISVQIILDDIAHLRNDTESTIEQICLIQKKITVAIRQDRSTSKQSYILI